MNLSPRNASLFLLLAVVTISSCQKEISFDTPPGDPGAGGGTGNNNNIIGEWDYVGITAHTEATISFTEAGQEFKTVSLSDYVSKNNTGTVKITATDIIASGVAYSIDTTVNVKTYVSNILLDQSEVPFVFDVPATSSTSAYTRNSNDSLTVTSWIGAPSTPSGPAPVGPTGIRIAWSGDTLLLKVYSTRSQSIVQQGVPANFVGVVSGVTKLKRR